MPIYQYHCESCDKTWDKICNLEQRDEPFVCNQCGSQCTRNQFPSPPAFLQQKYQQKDKSQQEPKTQGTDSPTGIFVRGPSANITIKNSSFSNLARGVVVDPQAQVSVEKSKFNKVKIPVERRASN